MKGCLKEQTEDCLMVKEKQRKQKLEIINPHLKAIGNLEARRCFVLYGDTREARVETPTYRIFDPEEPFDLAYTVDFYFPTANDALSCKSSLSYAGGEFAQDQRNMVILNHAFARCNEGIKQDGTSYPLIYTRGNGLYFASTKFAMPIMGALRNILLAMGREAIEELRLLYGEYLSQLDREGKPAELRRKVFKEAYDSKLELTLKKAGLIESKLEAVE